ncbi:nuclear transport factor 2-like isoform X2 [Apium graveolens]|uniref:nuclear transport factor 2-like isoform X2 n=1 Tax=Apium graveolens TaxID=4045 RepID=UPI003D79FC13
MSHTLFGCQPSHFFPVHLHIELLLFSLLNIVVHAIILHYYSFCKLFKKNLCSVVSSPHNTNTPQERYLHFFMMTVPEANHPAAVSLGAQYVGKAFVDQYYYVLSISPESVYKFYNESSVLGRPNTDGTMTSVTTLKDIDEKMQSVDCKNFKPEIETVDAQDSYQEGVIVVVTGSVVGADNVKRRFCQTFFLAPQEKGYFVLNDILRYVEERVQLEVNSKPVDSNGDSVPSATLTSDSDDAHVLPSYAYDPSNTFETENAEVCEARENGENCSPVDNEKHSDVVPEIVNEQQTDSSQNGTMAAISSDSSVVQQENRSYASILKVTKAAAYPASDLRWAPTKASPNRRGSPKLSSEPAASFPTIDNGLEGSNRGLEVEGHSIYIRNLPSNVTVEHVIEEFSKFGHIKHGGVQLKIHRQHGYRYGFVEFETVESMQNAIKESPIVLGRRHVVVEEKLSTIKVGSSGNTDRNTSGRGVYQDGFQRHGNIEDRYGGSEFRNNHNFSRRPTSNGGRNTEYRYQRVERVGVDKSGLFNDSDLSLMKYLF